MVKFILLHTRSVIPKEQIVKEIQTKQGSYGIEDHVLAIHSTISFSNPYMFIKHESISKNHVNKFIKMTSKVVYR